MFYLLKRVDEKQCTIGERVMTLSDFSGVPAGTKGRVKSIGDGGLVIMWEKCANCAKPDDCGANPSSFSDGFSREELQYLGFETNKQPNAGVAGVAEFYGMRVKTNRRLPVQRS